MLSACSIRVRGTVQGVGFRPFVFRLARENSLAGWVLNTKEGVEIFLEGTNPALHTFVDCLRTQAPPSASISAIEIDAAQPEGLRDFSIRESLRGENPAVRITADLPVCDACLRELFDPADRHHHYPYTNCTNCGPRYAIILSLPYDRSNTCMKEWPLKACCSGEYHDPSNRRFHAQPVACPVCGPHYFLFCGGEMARGDEIVIRTAAQNLRDGKILAVKGLGGYHLACDAMNVEAVRALRTRKYRKEKPFALMVRDMDVARRFVDLVPAAESLMNSVARPIVLAPSTVGLPEVAPENDELGVMLPYTPLHYLLFAAGAPDVLVLTSANRSSEPIAYRDDEALQNLTGIADAFLIGERPIARRVDDSVTRVGVFGARILRRARGYAPGAVAALPSERPILALGADLKNAITLVVDGQAFVSQHIGDLNHNEAFRAFQETIEDLLSMYEIPRGELLVVHDAHPQYVSTCHAMALPAQEKHAVQHHRAHIASVLAEHGAWDQTVIGVSFDGTGYGDDGTIWGGEILTGSVRAGFERVAHLRSAALPGGDAAASFPVQAAAGFLAQLGDLPDLTARPFFFPRRYLDASELVRKNIRTFSTTSMGRLFDTAAALLGFTREVTFEGQAAMWLERLARKAPQTDAYSFPFVDSEFDFRPLLEGLIRDRLKGRDVGEIARAFHRGIAISLSHSMTLLRDSQCVDTVVLSGGVFQNELLLSDLKTLLENHRLQVWINLAVPANDGGISLGQAALATFAIPESRAAAATERECILTEHTGTGY